MKQNQISKQTAPMSLWIVASIIFHAIIILLVMSYKLNMLDIEPSRMLRPDDKAVLWTQSPPAVPAAMPTPQPQEPKVTEKKTIEQKKETPNPAPEPKSVTGKISTIIAGKQGVDKQNLDGEITHFQQEYKEDLPETQSNQEEFKEQKTGPLYTTTPIMPNKSTFFSSSMQKHQPQTSKAMVEKTNDESVEEMQQHAPKQKSKREIKSLSFKNIGLGSNKSAMNFGNSAHMSIQGNSPDIPTGEELKYITYLNQMADMLIATIESAPKKHLISKRKQEQVSFYTKVDRSGLLLDAGIIRPNQNPMIDLAILEAVKSVRLYNQIPSFIKKDTFVNRWTWHN